MLQHIRFYSQPFNRFCTVTLLHVHVCNYMYVQYASKKVSVFIRSVPTCTQSKRNIRSVFVRSVPVRIHTCHVYNHVEAVVNNTKYVQFSYRVLALAVALACDSKSNGEFLAGQRSRINCSIRIQRVATSDNFWKRLVNI